MKILVKNNAEDVATAATEWSKEKIFLYKAQSCYLPAGNTPLPLYALWEKTKPLFLKNLKFQQIDEILEGDQKDIFSNFFKKNLPSFAVRSALETSEQANLAILGLGTNGHIAFHEPGIPMEFLYGEVKLSKETAANLGAKEGDRAISYGIQSFLKTDAVLLIVTGKQKLKILKSILQNFEKNKINLPAEVLLKHHDITILADSAAYLEIDANA